MIKLIVFLLLIMIVSLPTSVVAASCGAGTSANNAAVKMLQRQLSALRAIARGRGCKDGDTGGGLFNACRDVTLKISEVQQQLRASAGLDRSCSRERTTNVSRTKPSKITAVSAPASQAGIRQQDGTPSKVRGPRNALQFCVRLSDGYYFPTPNSQFSQKGGTDAALVQCRVICATQAMAVYVLDQNEETADMISVETGQSYADLPTAYNYHGEGDFRRCDWNGYVAKVSGLMAANKQSRSLANVEIPLPDAKPAEDDTAVSQISPFAYRPMPSREVRIIGPAFIPDVENKALELLTEQ
ncbi:hypothetical protein CES85_3627 (plasmid) [Ochrobactrum quorumnocens]|uniref:DUF2865 domain-containing protein n=1 Tax=Ochrobactrum quorumnocens TaxID=271865 RepID=A0A248UN72_9HYPH|nr:DUF2865 domain-containing protein [[Ochrobactrum] quorumnocens]ASV87759.1 hypothetical protein CES85_3627 [[Ochrobactrum] quorumnocens]